MKKIVNSDRAPKPVGPYNQAVMTGNTLYISGQIAIDPETNELVKNNIEAETKQVMTNLQNILKAANLEMKDIVKCSIFVSSMADYERINRVYADFFEESTAPARELVEVANLPKYVNIEISAIAAKP